MTLLQNTKSYPSGYGNPVVRFERNVDKINGPIHPIHGRCWVWTAGFFSNGYAAFYMNGKTNKAHRCSYVLYRGPLAAENKVLHKCDNRRCVNPDHLSVGTNADNSKDMTDKGRQNKGEDHPRAVLDEDKVRMIRKMYRWRHPKFGSFGLAQLFKCSQYAIMRVLQGKSWKHVV